MFNVTGKPTKSNKNSPPIQRRDIPGYQNEAEKSRDQSESLTHPENISVSVKTHPDSGNPAQYVKVSNTEHQGQQPGWFNLSQI